MVLTSASFKSGTAAISASMSPRRLPVFGASTGPSRRLQWAIASATTTAFDGQRRYIAAFPTPARDAMSSMLNRSKPCSATPASAASRIVASSDRSRRPGLRAGRGELAAWFMVHPCRYGIVPLHGIALASAELRQKLLGCAGDSFAIAGHQADSGATVHDVFDRQRTLVGDGVLEFRTRHVYPARHRLGGPLPLCGR